MRFVGGEWEWGKHIIDTEVLYFFICICVWKAPTCQLTEFANLNRPRCSWRNYFFFAIHGRSHSWANSKVHFFDRIFMNKFIWWSNLPANALDRSFPIPYAINNRKRKPNIKNCDILMVQMFDFFVLVWIHVEYYCFCHHTHNRTLTSGWTCGSTTPFSTLASLKHEHVEGWMKGGHKTYMEHKIGRTQNNYLHRPAFWQLLVYPLRQLPKRHDRRSHKTQNDLQIYNWHCNYDKCLWQTHICFD